MVLTTYEIQLQKSKMRCCRARWCKTRRLMDQTWAPLVGSNLASGKACTASKSGRCRCLIAVTSSSTACRALPSHSKRRRLRGCWKGKPGAKWPRALVEIAY